MIWIFTVVDEIESRLSSQKPFLLSADCWSWIKIEASRGRYLSPGTFVSPPHPQLTKIPHHLGLMRTTKNLQYKKLPACQNLPTEVSWNLVNHRYGGVNQTRLDREPQYIFSGGRQSYIYQVLQTIQMKLILLCVWAEPAVLGSAKTALKFIYKI